MGFSLIQILDSLESRSFTVVKLLLQLYDRLVALVKPCCQPDHYIPLLQQ